MRSPYGRSVATVVFAFALTVAPYAHASDASAGINDPLTDTLQLWGAVFQSIESMTQHLASLLQPPLTLDRSPQQQTPKAVAPSVAASVALATQSPPATATTSASASGMPITPQQSQSTNPSGAISDQTTHSLFVKSAASASPALPTPASTFVTRDQFNAALSNRIDPLIGIVGNLAALLPSLSASSAATPQWVAANGNPQVLGPAAPINQLNNVTINNPTISGLAASAIPDLSGSYLSRGGGTLSGAFVDSNTASSSFAGALGIGTTSPSDTFALNGAAYFADITAPSVTTNRLYSNSGSLYWAGSLIGGGGVGNWTSSGGNVYRASGNVGIDTATPSYALDVTGAGHFTSFADASYFVATSSGATTLLNGNLTVNGNTTLGSATSSNLAVTGTASTSVLVASNSFTFQNVTGFLKATAGAVATSLINLASDVTGILPVGNGGTGWSTIAPGAIPYGNGSSALATTTAGTAGYVLAYLNGVPTWTATTTLANISGKLAVGQGGTGTTTWQTGSIPFYNGTNLTENNSKLFWDNTNSRLGIGSTTPATTLSVSGNAYITGGLGVGAVNSQSGTFNGWTPSFGVLYSSGGQNNPSAIVAAGTGYVPGDTITLTGGIATKQAIMAVSATQVVSATVNAGGSGGTNGACTVTGTTGSFLSGSYFTASGTVSGGALTGPLTITSTGLYSTNPTSLSSEPVTGCGLSSATVTVVTGVGAIGVANPGIYSSIPQSPISQGSTSGSGTGASFSLSWGPVASQLDTGNLATNRGNFFIGGGINSAELAGGAWTGTGGENTCVGDKACHNLSSGSNITAVGHNAFGSDTSANGSGVGSNSVFVGTDAGRNATSTNGSIFIGSSANHDGGGANFDVGIGLQALYGNANASPSSNVAIGYQVMSTTSSSGAGSNNVGIGANVMTQTTGNSNVAIGQNAFQLDYTGFSNVAIGQGAAQNLTGGSGFVAIGQAALSANCTNCNNTTVVGNAAGQNLTGASVQNAIFGQSAANASASNLQNVALFGYKAGNVISGNGNTFVGSQAGLRATSGLNNIIIGYNAATSTTMTGRNNILIGSQQSNNNTIELPIAAGSNQLNIGNLIFGTGLTGGTNGTTNTIAGNIGIGTTTPYSPLEVWGPDNGASTTAFLVANSASTTEFYVSDNGNAVLAGGLTQNSDQRLKTNIQPLDASSSLAAINALNPVTFNWIDPSKGGAQLGFIAQQVFPIFPDLISTTSPTALTPDGTLGLNYTGLIAPIVRAIQALSAEITSIENTIADFAQSFTTHRLCLSDGPGDQSPVCVTKSQLAALLSQTASAGLANPSPIGAAPSTTSDTTPPAVSAVEPPVIHINGDNPASIHVGDMYSDLGATITGPQADLNLGIETFVNGSAMSPVQLDTTQAATDTIQYVVTDQSGLTATGTRMVIVEPAQPSSQAVTSTSDTVTSTTTQSSSAATATSTAATSTAQ